MLEPKHTIRAYKYIITAYNTTSKTYFEKKTKKWKEKKKEKKTFSPGSYSQPGLKVSDIVACQEAPLVLVGVTHQD